MISQISQTYHINSNAFSICNAFCYYFNLNYKFSSECNINLVYVNQLYSTFASFYQLKNGFSSKYPLGQNNFIELSTTMTICIRLAEQDKNSACDNSIGPGDFEYIHIMLLTDQLPFHFKRKRKRFCRGKNKTTRNYLLWLDGPLEQFHIYYLTFSLFSSKDNIEMKKGKS